MSSRPTAAILLVAITVGCSPAATALPAEGASTGIRAIHITRNGALMPSTIRTGARGSYLLDVALEDAAGTMHPRGDSRVTWGSTNPAVADGGDQPGSALIYLNRDGEAKIIAHLDGMRDTVTFQIAQVAVGGRVEADTVVTLSVDARNLNGAAHGYHEFRYGAARVDSNGYAVRSTVPMRFDVGVDPIFEVLVEPRGDTIVVRGIRKGTSALRTTFGEFTHSVPVQVADAYRVARLIETASGALLTIPDTVRIPAGAAVVFQNETRSFLMLDSFGPQGIEWRVGVINPNGRQAQVFSRPGIHSYSWNGGHATVIVTP